MKSKSTFIALLFIILGSAVCFAQNCNIGNEDSSVFDNSGDPFFMDFLAGVSFNLGEVGTLTSINLIGRNTGAGVQMAVYDDLNGVPNNLVAQSNIGTVTSGVVSLPVANTVLQPGDYWIMAVYETDDGHAFNTNNAPGNVVYFDSLIFGNPIPSNASGFQTYTGTDMAYFLEIECGILGIQDQETKSFLIYPNPTNSELNIQSDKTIKSVDIFSQFGALIITTNNVKIDVSQLSSGRYFIRAITESGFSVTTFVKN